MLLNPIQNRPVRVFMGAHLFCNGAPVVTCTGKDCYQMKRVAALLLALLLSAGLLAGCGGNAVNFVYYISDTISTLDPQLATTPAERTAVKNIFSGLYRLDADGIPKPDMALTTAVSGDGLVYTFTLNTDNAFTDGAELTQPVTAADYVFALQRTLNPATGSPYAHSFLSINGAEAVLTGQADPSTLGVRAVSDNVLEITLCTPDDGLAAKLALPGAMPCNEAFFESTSGAYGLSLKKILTNGPFEATAWSKANGLTLVRPAPANNKQINRVRLIPEDGEKTSATRLTQSLQDGALITGGDTTLDDTGYPSLKFETTTWLLVYNCTSPELSNLSVRQALSCTAQLAAEDLADYPYLHVATGLAPGGATLLNGSSYRTTVGNVLPQQAEAQCYALYRLGLSELGVDRLSGLKVLLPNTAPWDKVYSLVNQRWQRNLSAFFSVDILPEDEIRALVAKNDFDIALLPVTMTASDTSLLFTQFLSGESSNLPQYVNPQFDGFVGTGLAATSASGQADALRSAETLLLSDAAVTPLAFQTNYFYLSPSLSGVIISPFGPVIDLTEAAEH